MHDRTQILVGALATLFAGACHSTTDAPRAPEFPSRMIEGEPLYDVLPPDAIPAIDEPTFVTADEAELFLVPDEPVLGVVGKDGTAKCYSAWHLEAHEIVNDELDGEPIAATW